MLASPDLYGGSCFGVWWITLLISDDFTLVMAYLDVILLYNEAD
jgi:hypothetical protein